LPDEAVSTSKSGIATPRHSVEARANDNQAATWINQNEISNIETRGIMMHINDSSPSNKTCFYIWPIIIILLISSASCAVRTPQPTPVSGKVIAVVNGLLIDGSGAEPIPDAILLIHNDRIVAVGTQASLTVPENAQIIDAKGGTILPGFINTHVHRGFNENNLAAWLRGGVTTVRDESIIDSRPLKELIAWRDKINSNAQYARLVSAGYMIGVPGGYGEVFINSPEEARQKVFEELDSGVDMIKVSLEDGYAGRSGLPKLSPEELSVIVSAAHERNVRVSGHITQAQYIKPLVEAGVDDIAHIAYDPIPPETIQLMIEKGVFLVPTFTVFRNYNAPIETCVQNLAEFVKAGGKVALGNDYGGGPGEFELGIPMYEIEQMTAAGMTPMQIITASTSNAAQVVGLEDEIGVLEPGKIADLLILPANPLDDLNALTQINFVIHNGEIIRAEVK
jgi:imidazolonepropionase-like amidohydrolase